MADMPRVVIINPIRDDVSAEQEVLQGVARVEGVPAHDEGEVADRASDAVAILLWHDLTLTDRCLARLKKTRLVVRMGVGFDNIDVNAAAARGIAVGNVPDYGTEDVADAALGMTLALLRGSSPLNSRLRAGASEWGVDLARPLHRVRGRTFAIVGIGRIGTATARRAAAFGMDVVFHDPYVKAGTDKALGIRRADSLDELLAQANVLSLHCPLTEETHGLIGSDAIGKMPDGSILINTARGPVVDLDAVLAGLESGGLSGAGLDVLPVEPPTWNEPLLKAWKDPNHPAHHRLMVTPHVAFYTEEGLLELRRKGADAARRLLLGKPLLSQVNSPI